MGYHVVLMGSPIADVRPTLFLCSFRGVRYEYYCERCCEVLDLTGHIRYRATSSLAPHMKHKTIRNNSKIYFNSLHRSRDVNWSKVYFRIAKQTQSCFSVWILRRLQILLLPFQLGITPIDPDVVSNQDCQQFQQWLIYKSQSQLV